VVSKYKLLKPGELLLRIGAQWLNTDCIDKVVEMKSSNIMRVRRGTYWIEPFVRRDKVDAQLVVATTAPTFHGGM
jgi:hypothetical protein